MAQVHIKSVGSGARAEVYLDGKRLDSVRSFELTYPPVGVPTLTLDLNCFDLTVDGEWLTRQKYLDEEIRRVVLGPDGKEEVR